MGSRTRTGQARPNANPAVAFDAPKWHAVSNGADMLLAYSEAKRAIIEMIVAEARVLLARDHSVVPGRPSAGSGTP